MKKTLRNVTLGLALLSMLSLATVANAAIGDKTYDKLKEAVSNASPDDWMIYAKSAQKLIRKKAHLGEAKEWITKSLVISESAFNREVYGDYYMANNLPREAVEQYYKSMELKKKSDPNANLGTIQDKMFRAKQQALENKL